jgi:hypothetical protein
MDNLPLYVPGDGGGEGQEHEAECQEGQHFTVLTGITPLATLGILTLSPDEGLGICLNCHLMHFETSTCVAFLKTFPLSLSHRSAFSCTVWMCGVGMVTACPR